MIGLAAFLSVSFAAEKPLVHTGEIIKNAGTSVLLDAATKVVCQLDDQKKSKYFAGAEVVVTGTLDKATTTIHIKGIRTAPGIQNVVQWGVR